MKKLALILIFLFLTLIVYSQELFNIKKNDVLSTSNYNEFCPFYYQNKIVYCSDKPRSIFISITDSLGHNMIDLYLSKRDSSNKWMKPKKVTDVNTLYFDGPACVYKNQMYISQNISAHNKKAYNKNNLGIFIYRADRIYDFSNSGYIENDEKWIFWKPFQYNGGLYNVTHPNISSDGRYLFFSSDKPGGKGGYDLYICEARYGTWSKPKPLPFNSESHDVYPYYHQSGYLYYSVKSKDSGTDLYYTYITDSNKWKTPIKMSINSNKDDFGITFNSDMTEGFFSSNRDNTDDIYNLFIVVPEFECREEETECYYFYMNELLDIDSTIYSYEWDMGDGSKFRKKDVYYCYPKDGDYQIEFNIIDTTTNEILKNELIYLKEIRRKNQLQIVKNEVLYTGDNLFIASDSLLKTKISHYYWKIDGDFVTGNKIIHKFNQPGEYIINLGGIDKMGKRHCVSTKIKIEN